MENRVDKLDTLDKKTTSKLLCGTCFKTKGYETMTDIERKGIVSEGICADCGSPAELLIQLKESSWGGGDIF
jgi:superfamily II helicase